ncbi:MAG: hypothetical protein ACI4GC_05590 [Acutalibacteraceae bacterium]
MSEVVIVALISLLGTLGGSFAGIITSGKLTNFRLSELEKKVEKLSGALERTILLEAKEETQNQSLQTLSNRLDRIEKLNLN